MIGAMSLGVDVCVDRIVAASGSLSRQPSRAWPFV
jgi:hypothetical protein